MDLILDSLTLPNYTEFEEITDQNANEIISLDGTLTVDFINYRRGWRVMWDSLLESEYALLKAKHDLQFSSGNMLSFEVPDRGIDTTVYLKMQATKLFYSGQVIRDFTILLLEQDPVT